MVAFGDVRHWRADPLHEAVGDLNRWCTALLALPDELDAAATTPSWTGEAAVAAARRLGPLRDGLEDAVAETSALRQALGETADAVTGLAHALAEIDYLATTHHFHIAHDGAVHDNGAPTPTEEAARERERLKVELTDRVEQLLHRANDIDTDLSHVLTRILGDQVNAGPVDGLTAASSAGAAAGHLSMIEPPPRGTPTDNAGWYASLGPGEKAWLLAHRPDLIGNMDGVPAADRDKANRARIPLERARLEAEQTRAQAAGDTEAAGRFKAQLDSLSRIEDMLERTDRHLLLLDTTGERTRAAVSIGDVDTADHVAVFTPGMNSSVNGNMAGYDDDMNGLRARTEQELEYAGRSHETVAVVTWLGYEPPNTNSMWDAMGAASDDRAVDGADRLAPFLEGINTSRPSDPHLTALGHSYGSLTTGIALRDHPGTGVDEAVFFGSPGLGVDRGTDLNVPQEHSYNMSAPDDPVAHIGITGHHGELPYVMQDMTQMSTREYTAPDGRHFEASSGHSEYLRYGDAYTTSEWNMATIIGGTGAGARI